jgi:H+-translocating NAD(P) transhydrogenase subunit beta
MFSDIQVTEVTAVLALGSMALFVVGLKQLSQVRTSRRATRSWRPGMLLAVIITLIEVGRVDYRWILIGLVVGSAIGVLIVVRAKATQMPEIVARFNGFGGAASALVALSLFWGQVVETEAGQTTAAVLGGASATTLVLSVLIGSITFSGSVLAELKLRGTFEGSTRIPLRGPLMGLVGVGGLALGIVATFSVDDAAVAVLLVVGLFVAAMIAGVVLVVPIGGADMPVVISLLNSLSGLAAAATGFALANNLLIMAGTIVGAAGLILTQIMCKAMNRSLLNVLVGGYGGDGGAAGSQEYGHVISGDAEEAAMVLEVAESVVIVPGYGLAVARAQHAVYEVAEALAAKGVRSGSASTRSQAACPAT